MSLASGSQTNIRNHSENDSIYFNPENKKSKNCVVADVVILGCSLPGMVTAHKLKEKFGNSMDIVVLDLPRPKLQSKLNVSFRGLDEDDAVASDEDEEATQTHPTIPHNKALLIKLVKDFSIPVPEFMLNPQDETHFLNKLFENYDGSTVYCTDGFNDFTFLNFLERFELKQYQRYLDCCTMSLFVPNRISASSGRDELMLFDRTSMEEHICLYLLFPTSREIMRITVRLTCGASPDSVSVLFYLHQCFRSNGSKNQIDGDNTMFREKLLGYFRKRLPNNIEESVADITLRIKPIREIRQFSDEQVILETLRGETDYVCNLLAMALNPDQLKSIQFQEDLLARDKLILADKLLRTKTKKFFIQYEDNFWRREGCSGDILSLRGPILWAIETRVSVKGSFDKYSGLIGYLKDTDTTSGSSPSCKAAVLEQLVNLFGKEAAEPLTYIETEIQDLFVPPRGEYLSLKNLKECYVDQKLQWSALDVYADGDIASAIEAGHITYLQVVKSLRPQAADFDETKDIQGRIVFHDSPLTNALAKINFPFCLQVLAVSAGAYMAFTMYRIFRDIYRN